MQFQVPQFIETEDKIVGPLTLRQFFYIGAAVGVSGMLYFVLQTWLWLIITLIVFAAAVAISFIKIQGRPLVNVITSAVGFYWKPQTYVWQPEHPALGTLARRRPAEKKKGKIVPAESPAADDTRRKDVALGDALRKSWRKVLTGELMSDKQFTENRMYGRYQIFQKLAGDRNAARRVDYR